VNESSRIFRNTLSQSAPIVTTFVFGFVLAPVMLSRLGLAQFGVWAVTGALAQYARLLDLGITSSLSRFVALYDAEGNRRGIEETVAIGMMAGLAVGLVVIAAAFFAAPLVAEVLGVLDTGEMRIVLVSSAASATIFLIAAVLSAVPIGLRRMGPPNVAYTIGNVINFAFSLGALVLSTKLTDYALANLASGVIGLGITVGALLWVWERPFARRPTLARTRGIVSFGLKSQLVTLANLVNVQTDKLIIAAMLGPRTAGAYEIGNRVVQGVLSLGVMTLSALIPTATADLVKRGREVILEYFVRYTRRTLAIALPLFGAVVVAIPYLLVAWLGERPPDTTEITALLSLAFAVSMTTGVAMTLVVADGHPGLVAQTATIVVVLNVTATIVAAPIFGLWGVLLATVGAELFVSILFLWRFGRRYSLHRRDFLRALAEPCLFPLLAMIPFALWYALVGTIPEQRLPAVIGALATGGSYGLACWLYGSRRGLLPEKLSVWWLTGKLRGHPEPDNRIAPDGS
jgi:O-antigen/teichoic acid export membrane protein